MVSIYFEKHEHDSSERVNEARDGVWRTKRARGHCEERLTPTTDREFRVGLKERRQVPPAATPRQDSLAVWSLARRIGIGQRAVDNCGLQRNKAVSPKH
jgi:hypothetical protein